MNKDQTGEEPWGSFKPQEQAVTVYILTDSRILLIHKKRGLGNGKINAPGGRLEAGESFHDAAVRETREEIGLEVSDLKELATLLFTFTDGFTLEVRAFVTRSYSGTPLETDEADPFWCDITNIPFDRMWADDKVWLPEVIRGRYVVGRFIFDGDNMIESSVSVQPQS
jgi:8-oxo-dGTP diphosphatase